MAKRAESTKRLSDLRAEGTGALMPIRPRVTVGTGTCGGISGAYEIVSALKDAGLGIDVVEVGCEGLCWAEPVIGITMPCGVRYVFGFLNSQDAVSVVATCLDGDYASTHFLGKTFVCENEQGDIYEENLSVPRISGESRAVSRRCGFIEPCSVREYVATGGYRILTQLVLGEKSSEEVMRTIEASGLRGCGGAGFPTWLKWMDVANSKDSTRYLVANADEGDPGAYMDRSLMEGDPHALIEGMAIAAFCLGVREAYVFTRVEYEQAASIMKRAIEEAGSHGFLGSHVLQTEWSFSITMVRSGGAYICGEETALLNALENHLGVPRKKPPYPTERGLWGHPTCINNVETLVNVPIIASREEDDFIPMRIDSHARLTKMFCITGSELRTGLVELPLGTPIQRLVEYATEGSDCALRAIQVGGPSGAVLPADIEVELDFDALGEYGAIMGSGGVVLLSVEDCIVETVRYFIGFNRMQSCKRCSCCKDGLAECSRILDRIVNGEGVESDVGTLQRLASEIPEGSLCGLGKSSTRGLSTALAFFQNDFYDHIQLICPALSCKALIQFNVEKSHCPGCLCCLPSCPSNAMKGKLGKPFLIDQSLCQKCWMCVSMCPYQAIRVSQKSSSKKA